MLRFGLVLVAGLSAVASRRAPAEDFARRLKEAHSDVRQMMDDIPSRISRCTENGRYDSRHRLCHCLPSYTGVYCELPQCQHGVPYGGSCICNEPYEGTFCDRRMLHTVYEADDSRIRVILLTVGAVLMFSALLFGTRLAVGKWLENSSTIFTEWNIRNKNPSAQTLCEPRTGSITGKSCKGATNPAFSGVHYDSMSLS
uniref:EGF-like domain-containing protein n=1 Tax=Plectus sambesii TaxID=2011161 RepID=A0A914V7Y8_9BILA